jgi:mRNA interferase RelE/StbE
MNFHVELSSKAFRSLSKLDGSNKKRAFNKIESLENTPFPTGFKKLSGENDVYRLRFGNYRILYKVSKPERTILVFRIEKRSRVYQ